MQNHSDYRRPDGFSDLVRRSAKEQKPLLVVISAADHIDSRRFQVETLENPQVMMLLDHGFLYYRAHTGRHYAHSHQLSRRLGIHTYPGLALLNSEEEVLWQHEGYLSPSELIGQLARYLPATTPAINPAIMGFTQNQDTHTVSGVNTPADPFEITDNLESAQAPALPPQVVQADKEDPNPGIEDRPSDVPRNKWVYGLIIKTSKDLQEIQHMARRWQLVWKGELWVQRLHNDAHRLILGSFDTERNASQKRRQLRARNGIRARLYTFRPLDMGPDIVKY